MRRIVIEGGSVRDCRGLVSELATRCRARRRGAANEADGAAGARPGVIRPEPAEGRRGARHWLPWLPVEPATKTGCCGPADALQLRPEQMRQDFGGVWHAVIDGADHAVVDPQGAPIAMLPSNDGCFWVWYRRENAVGTYTPEDPHGGGGAGYHFYCLEGPFPVRRGRLAGDRDFAQLAR